MKTSILMTLLAFASFGGCHSDRKDASKVKESEFQENKVTFQYVNDGSHIVIINDGRDIEVNKPFSEVFTAMMAKNYDDSTLAIDRALPIVHLAVINGDSVLIADKLFVPKNLLEQPSRIIDTLKLK